MLHTIIIKDTSMDNENRPCNTVDQPTRRITRSRAKALGPSGGLPPLYPSAKENEKRVLRANSKRGASDESKSGVSATASIQHKKRGVLKDVANLTCRNTGISCIGATKTQPSKQEKKCLVRKNEKSAPAVNGKKPRVLEDAKENMIEEITKVKVEELRGICSPVDFEESKTTQASKCISTTEFHQADLKPITQNASNHVQLQSPSQKEEVKHCQKQEGSDGLGVADIDSKHRDPQMCSLYAPDIYRNLQTMELGRRPSVDYMETMQQDITQGMRGILIDWLVEVSEEYRLVPDTLYLTVNLIDRFLSDNYIEKQKLQLLGVTCMLIASKYEEICAPRVEEFCFITDNTYTKEEVVKMESRVLNILGFQLSVPTTKKFLRRFIQAAQICYEVPSVELEFLANYLAELTLLEYNFLKFLPSLIAASVVFLARWTLDQSDHPWNLTLEHYTSYKSSELKIVVLALQDLLLNTNGSTLNAIREKYRQPKFKSVATLSPTKPVQSLF